MKPTDFSPSWHRPSALSAALVLMRCGRYSLPLAVPACTVAQPGVTRVPAGGRNHPQVTENAKAGELSLEVADVALIRKDVIALGEPVKV